MKFDFPSSRKNCEFDKNNSQKGRRKKKNLPNWCRSNAGETTVRRRRRQSCPPSLAACKCKTAPEVPLGLPVWSSPDPVEGQEQSRRRQLVRWRLPWMTQPSIRSSHRSQQRRQHYLLIDSLWFQRHSPSIPPDCSSSCLTWLSSSRMWDHPSLKTDGRSCRRRSAGVSVDWVRHLYWKFDELSAVVTHFMSRLNSSAVARLNFWSSCRRWSHCCGTLGTGRMQREINTFVWVSRKHYQQSIAEHG